MSAAISMERAQSRYDNMRPPSESELPAIEATEEQRNLAVDHLASDAARLLDFLNESPFYAEFMDFMYGECPRFSTEFATWLETHHKKTLDEVAQDIAEKAHAQAVEDAFNDQPYSED